VDGNKEIKFKRMSVIVEQVGKEKLNRKKELKI
jgi:hypothetical protein